MWIEALKDALSPWPFLLGLVALIFFGAIFGG